MASPKTLEKRVRAKVDELRMQHPVTRLDDFREEVQKAEHKQNRLMMLMHQFLDAEQADDSDGMRMAGRGLSGFTREELNQAYADALKTRAQPPESA